MSTLLRHFCRQHTHNTSHYLLLILKFLLLGWGKVGEKLFFFIFLHLRWRVDGTWMIGVTGRGKPCFLGESRGETFFSSFFPTFELGEPIGLGGSEFWTEECRVLMDKVGVIFAFIFLNFWGSRWDMRNRGTEPREILPSGRKSDVFFSYFLIFWVWGLDGIWGIAALSREKPYLPGESQR